MAGGGAAGEVGTGGDFDSLPCSIVLSSELLAALGTFQGDAGIPSRR